jgi:ferredoxin
MIAGRTPFCYLPIPLLILPAALTKTVVFPGSILPGGGMSGGGMAAMAGLWLAITLTVGKGWCSYACFFGGIEEGMASVPTRAKLRKIDPRWRYGPWAVLLAMVLLSLALFEPVYCLWLCPFKAVSEYVAARNAVGMVQNGIFVVLFAGLVIALPLLTKKRTQCAFFCPFGAFQSIFNKTSVFDVKIDPARCTPCVLCQSACPTMSLTKESIARGETLMSCMKCGACVDACPKDAAVWHIRGTEVAIKPERARLMFLYAAWGMARRFQHTEGPAAQIQRIAVLHGNVFKPSGRTEEINMDLGRYALRNLLVARQHIVIRLKRIHAGVFALHLRPVRVKVRKIGGAAVHHAEKIVSAGVVVVAMAHGDDHRKACQGRDERVKIARAKPGIKQQRLFIANNQVHVVRAVIADAPNALMKVVRIIPAVRAVI